MSLVIDKIRRWVKGSGTTAIVPTIPVSNDHTDGSWIATDIYDREMFVNTEDLAVFIRCKNTILRVNNNVATAINTNTANFTKNLSVADTTVQKALQTFNDANLGHIIKDNGTAKTAKANLNFVGFTITEDSTNTIVTLNLSGAVILQGVWDASLNLPDITGATQTGYSWQVSVAGATDLGGITDWNVGDWAVKTSIGWIRDSNPVTSDDVPEGATNKYFLGSRVLSSVLTGLSLVANQVISATDTVLQAFGYLQKQLTDLALLSEYDCSVGIGGDYATFNLARVAGKTRPLFISNVTEVSAITWDAGVDYRITGIGRFIVWNTGAFDCVGTAGNVTISNITVTTGNVPNTGYAFRNTSGLIRNCTINLNAGSSSNVCLGVFNLEYCTWNIGNFSGGRVIAGTADHCLINGGGTNLYWYPQNSIVNSVLTKGDITNCTITGTFAIVETRGCNFINNISYATFSLRPWPNTVVKGCNMPNVTLDTINNSSPSYPSETFVSDCIFSTLNGSSYNVTMYWRLTNVKFTSTSLINIDNSYNAFTNCSFRGSVTLVTGANANKFTNCYIGTTASGGKTITINAGATKNTIIGCTTESATLPAIVDNGTGTEKGFNTIF